MGKILMKQPFSQKPQMQLDLHRITYGDWLSEEGHYWNLVVERCLNSPTVGCEMLQELPSIAQITEKNI
jgi:hypothetical protein